MERTVAEFWRNHDGVVVDFFDRFGQSVNDMDYSDNTEIIKIENCIKKDGKSEEDYYKVTLNVVADNDGRGERILHTIKGYFEEVRVLFPDITSPEFSKYDVGGRIRFCNQCFGTKNEWLGKHRLPYFVREHDVGEGFTRVEIQADDTVIVTVYPDGCELHKKPFVLEKRLEEGDAEYLAVLLFRVADDKMLLNYPVGLLDFGHKVSLEDVQDLYYWEEGGTSISDFVYQKIEDMVQAIFLECQEEFGISTGDILPDMQEMLDDAQEQLTEIVGAVLEYQKDCSLTDNPEVAL